MHTIILRWCDDGPWAQIWHRDHRSAPAFAGFGELDDALAAQLISNGAHRDRDGFWQHELPGTCEAVRA